MSTLAKLLALTALCAAGGVQAHVTVQPKTALPGAHETLRFVVGHGCDGQPTTGLRVDFPAGVDKIQPQPKAGWSIRVLKSQIGAAELVWSGGSFGTKEADSFEVKVKLPGQAGALAFPAFQSCGSTTTGWTETATPEVPKPTHPVPVLTLTTEAPTVGPTPPAAPMPEGVQVRNGDLIDPTGLPLYTFDFDTMVGMSHCVGVCLSSWRPFLAPAGARPMGDWTLIGREDGAIQWAYRTKPLYTYLKDTPGGRATGAGQDNWRRAESMPDS